MKWLTYCLTIYNFWRIGNSIFFPYCFHLNRENYAQNLSNYYVYMQALEEENLTAYKYLEQDGFNDSLTGKPHSRIPFD